MSAPDQISMVVYTDYKSPYAFVADRAISALAVQYPVEITWRPYTLRIAEFLGNVEGRSPHAWRRVRYSYMDARRLANRQGLTLKGPRRVYSAELSSIGMLFAQDRGVFEAYHASTFERFWNHDLDIDSLEEMSRHIDALGQSGADFERFAQAEGAQRHRQIIEHAESIGVFGVPTVVIEDELFWGGDRLWMVREALENSLLEASRERRHRTG